ncbi:type I-C CRISPR-associated protein Cas5c [Peptostreptococcus faecalis]|uniref:type I-C CRISPR-associated protein Cas5c n=1 Tax=Peptostreptococcus faecalis TaxID=2045015 RepID=UPI000C7970D5|nr:type I-C CRISPR-associated protein Cas5c [Peptostreptococcus faecalis]
MDKFKSKAFYYKLSGDYALFTDPITKGGGEKFSYSVPTVQALKGITEAIYWKPTIAIYIDEVKIINPIRTQTKGIRTLVKNGTSVDRNYYTYLKDVEYYVKFHFEWNELREDLKHDRNEIKHQEIILRTLDKGCRRDIFLGTRECLGFVERLTREEYEQKNGYYHEQSISMGIMFHSFNYPTEVAGIDNSIESNFSQITMEKGVIHFIRPEECTIKNILGEYKGKFIKSENIKTVENELEELNEVKR